jgi:hypothetical protein
LTDGGEPATARPLLRRTSTWLLLLLPVHAALLAFLPARAVEAAYGQGAFPLLARAHAALDGTVVSPAVTLGALLLGFAVASAALAARKRPRPGRTFAGALAWRLLLVVAGLAHAFAPSWGLNYRRPSVAERLALDTSVTKATLRRTSDRVIRATNAARVPWGEPDLDALEREVDAAVHATLRDLGLGEASAPGRRVRLLPRGLMAMGGWSGVTLPWTTEAMVDPACEPRCLPHAMAHEKAHQAGFARECDANFIAWLSLVRSDDPRLRYSTLFYVADLFEPHAGVKLEPEVVADVKEAVALQQAIEVPVVAQSTSVVYDAYLKANTVESGVANYDEVAALIHGWLVAHPETLKD